MAIIKGYITFKSDKITALDEEKRTLLSMYIDDAFGNCLDYSVGIDIFRNLLEDKDNSRHTIQMDQFIGYLDIHQEVIDRCYTVLEPYIEEADLLYIGFNDSYNLDNHDFFRDTFKDGKWYTEEVELTFNKTKKEMNLVDTYGENTIKEWKDAFESENKEYEREER